MCNILITGKSATGGRNRGTISTPRRKSLVAKKYRFLDFKRNVCKNQALELLKKEIKDPNRTANLSLIYLKHGYFTKILASQYTKKQKVVKNYEIPKNPKETGYSAKIITIPLGTILHNLEMLPERGGKLIRAAGTSAVLLKIVAEKCLIKLNSGEHRYLSNQILACFGAVGNHEHFLNKLKKAGDTRLRGRKSRVRPSAMNPVDHPMGGRTKGGCAPQSKTGKLSHGPSTLGKKSHNLILISSRKNR